MTLRARGGCSSPVIAFAVLMVVPALVGIAGWVIAAGPFVTAVVAAGAVAIAAALRVAATADDDEFDYDDDRGDVAELHAMLDRGPP